MNRHPPAGRYRSHHTLPDEAPRRRRHPARGARAVALSASVVATGAVAAALAYSEGAWSAPTSTSIASDTTTSTATTSTATTSTATTSTATTTVASTSSAPETTQSPETTQTPDTTIASSGWADGEFLGTAEYTEWGDVQVNVTISDGAIVDVEAVQYPTGRKSTDINSQAIPMLEANAIATQNADVDIVSGATYTSHTYADSLQAALDEAALAVTQQAGTS